MTKSIKTLTTIILALLLISTAALPVLAVDFNFETAISGFNSTFFNTKEIAVGSTDDTVTSCVFLLNETAFCSSSNESVVTVASDGTVTAVGEGTAYVAVVVPNDVYDDMYELYRYDVVASSSNDDNSANSLGAIELSTQATDDYNSSSETISDQFQSDYEQSVEEMKNDYEQSVEELKNDHAQRTEEMEKEAAERQEAAEKRTNIFKVIFFIMLAIILTVSFYDIVTTFHLSSASMKKKELPSRKQTANTITTPLPDIKACPKCGKEYGESTFCPDCGTSKKVKSTYIVPINKKMTAQKFEKLVNEWLAENPYAHNCKIKLDTKASLILPFVNYKFFVKSAVIEYNVADEPQNHQYGLAFIYKFRLFGPIGYSKEKHVAEWQENNPDCTVISTHGGRIQHFDNQGGFWAQYYNYVFFKK